MKRFDDYFQNNKVIPEEITPVVSYVKGDRGPVGPMGPPGPPGPPGEDGWAGPAGVKGDKGDRGPQGPVGPVGPVGPEGPPGIAGRDGWPGDKGEPGLQGPQGEKGDTGEIGPQGPVGPEGPQGVAGIPGKDGVVGPKGDKGEPGQAGAKGERGPQGPKGDSGKQGEPGPKGERGLKGAKGDSGPKGDKGAKGDPGKRGEPGSPGIVSANFPLVLEDQTLSFDGSKFKEDLTKLVKTKLDAQTVAQNFQWLNTGSVGGGAVGIYKDQARIIKSVNDINFKGSGAVVSRKGKQVDVEIDNKIGRMVYKFTSKRIPGIGEFTVDTSDWTDTTGSSGTAFYSWFRVNALKDWINNSTGTDFPLSENPVVVTYEDYWNCLDSVDTSYPDSEYGSNINLTTFLGLVYITELDAPNTEPMQLCIHANTYADGTTGGVIGWRYPNILSDWNSWSEETKDNYPALFDVNFDGIVNSTDATTITNYGYYSYGWGFTPGGGDRVTSTIGELNPRFVEGKEYYIWIVAPHIDSIKDNLARVVNSISIGGSGFYESQTAPTGTINNGDRWWNTSTGRLYTRISGVWIET